MSLQNIHIYSTLCFGSYYTLQLTQCTGLHECLSGVHICLQQCTVARTGSKYALTIYVYVYIVNALNNGFDINGVPEIEVQLCIVIL